MNRGSWSHVLNAEEGKAWSGITSSPIFWVALCVAASLALAVFLYVVAARHAAEDAMIGLPEGIQLVDVADTDEPFPTRRSFRLEPPPLPPRKRDMRTPTPHFYAWLPSPDGQVEAKAGPTLPYVAVRPRAPSLLERLDDAAPDAAPSPGERRIALPSLLLRGGPGVSTAFVVEWDLAAGDSSRALLFRKNTGKFGIEESTRRFAGRLDTEPMLWSVALPECAMCSGGGGAAQRVQNRVEWNAIPWTTLPPLGTAMAEPIKVLTTSRERAAERARKRAARAGVEIKPPLTLKALPLGLRQPLGVANGSARWSVASGAAEASAVPWRVVARARSGATMEGQTGAPRATADLRLAFGVRLSDADIDTHAGDGYAAVVSPSARGEAGTSCVILDGNVYLHFDSKKSAQFAYEVLRATGWGPPLRA